MHTMAPISIKYIPSVSGLEDSQLIRHVDQLPYRKLNQLLNRKLNQLPHLGYSLPVHCRERPIKIVANNSPSEKCVTDCCQEDHLLLPSGGTSHYCSPSNTGAPALLQRGEPASAGKWTIFLFPAKYFTLSLNIQFCQYPVIKQAILSMPCR